MFPEFRERDLSVLTFNVTWYCPVKCPYCYRAMQVSRDDKATLSRHDLMRECKTAGQYGIKEYRLSGGEPTAIGDKLFEYADAVYDIVGLKPTLLTSGVGISETWLRKARNRFGVIAVSVENPLGPLQTVVDHRTVLKIIRECASEELPFRYGLTLVTASHFKDIEAIFDILYENVDGRFMPQLDYPCLKDFINPSPSQLDDLRMSTSALFRKYEAIPHYFVYLIGSLIWLYKDVLRIVLNLHPDGRYEVYDSLLERWQVEYKWQLYALEQQSLSSTCKKCGWVDSCRHHPGGLIRYDWCDVRRAIFEGVYDGLGVDPDKNSKNHDHDWTQVTPP